MRLLTIIVILVGLSTHAAAIEPDEVLDDPILEQRARAISQQIRCVVCDGESIDQSSADIARVLRQIIRQKLQDRASDEEIFSWVQARYGDAILMNTPLKASTILLWLSPLILILGLAILGWRLARRQSKND